MEKEIKALMNFVKKTSEEQEYLRQNVREEFKKILEQQEKLRQQEQQLNKILE